MVTRVLASAPGVALLADVPVLDDRGNRWCELEGLRLQAVGLGALLTGVTVEWTSQEGTQVARATAVRDLPAGQGVPVLDGAMLRSVAHRAAEVHFSGSDLAMPAMEMDVTFHVVTAHAEVSLPVKLRTLRSAPSQPESVIPLGTHLQR